MPPLKKVRTIEAVSPDVPWGALLRLLEASENRAAESSRAAVVREGKLTAAVSLVATTLMQQNRLLARIEERLKAIDREEISQVSVPIEIASDSDEDSEMAEDSEGKGEATEVVEKTSKGKGKVKE